MKEQHPFSLVAFVSTGSELHRGCPALTLASQAVNLSLATTISSTVGKWGLEVSINIWWLGEFSRVRKGDLKLRFIFGGIGSSHN
ncbi:Uncharacterized protein TCM_013854 [Theobroma cacao]|uniref:Uncharacterized protein n=1 Tax=Theobroma cacao TaxID=3641 RepID=A0A061FW65_THECC|nr:Uncharacterized protein TCM_013854 [Theobroma cacao]